VLQPNAQRIRAALEQGVGAMPSYANQLSNAEINALIRFITRTQ
jgi:mono/diheme cytochrome c family protein